MKILKVLLIAIIILLTYESSISQNPGWFVTIGGSQIDQSSTLIQDNEGNIITSGSFQTDLYVYSDSMKLTNEHNTSYYLIKLSKSGALLWQKKIASDGALNVRAMTFDNNGNIYFGGYYEKVLYYDTLIMKSENLNSSNLQTAFLFSINKNGGINWVKNFKCNLNSFVRDISVKNNDLFVSIGYRDSIISFDNKSYFGLPLTSKLSYSAPNTLLCKFNLIGQLTWIKVLTSEFFCSVDKFAFDKNNNIFIAGKAAYKNFKYNGTQMTLLDSTGALFIAKLTQNGDIIWIRYGYTAYWGGTQGLKISDDFRIFWGGYFNYYLKLPDLMLSTKNSTLPRDDDIFVIGLDSNANIEFGKSFGNTDQPDYISGFDLKNNLVFSGTFANEFILDTFHLYTNTNRSIFISTMDYNGNIETVLQTKSYLSLTSAYSTTLLLDKDGQIFLSGYFNSGTQFDTIVPDFRGYIDAFIWCIDKKLISRIRVEDGIINNRISLYPNPTLDRLMISSPFEKGKYNVAIYDIIGNKVIENINFVSEYLDVSKLEKGYYTIICTYDKHMYKAKFIKL